MQTVWFPLYGVYDQFKNLLFILQYLLGHVYPFAKVYGLFKHIEYQFRSHLPPKYFSEMAPWELAPIMVSLWLPGYIVDLTMNTTL